MWEGEWGGGRLKRGASGHWDPVGTEAAAACPALGNLGWGSHRHLCGEADTQLAVKGGRTATAVGEEGAFRYRRKG